MPAHLKNWRYWFIWFNYRYLYFKLANRDQENRGEKKLSAPWLEQLEVLRQNLGQQYVYYILFQMIIINRGLRGTILIGAGSKPTGQVIGRIPDTAKFFQFNDSTHNFYIGEKPSPWLQRLQDWNPGLEELGVKKLNRPGQNRTFAEPSSSVRNDALRHWLQRWAQPDRYQADLWFK